MGLSLGFLFANGGHGAKKSKTQHLALASRLCLAGRTLPHILPFVFMNRERTATTRCLKTMASQGSHGHSEPTSQTAEPSAHAVSRLPTAESAEKASQDTSSSPSLPDIAAIGLTNLWEPANQSEVIADICFIHGLGGHPRQTWQHGTEKVKKKSFLSRIFPKSSKESTRSWGDLHESIGDDSTDSMHAMKGYCYWPFDLLRRDFDNIRILTYGYDSNPSHWYKDKNTQMTIDQHTQTMLQKISNSRVSCRKRPIIFIAHSLGGILVKNTIILSAKYKHGNAQLRDISESCRAIIFFGTPHRGASSAELGTMVANVIGALPGGPSVYKNILRSLQPDSEKLVSIITDFNDIMEENIPASDKIQIYSFQEGQGYSRITAFDNKVSVRSDYIGVSF